MAASSQPSMRRSHLNPFFLPSDTDFRFVLLIFSVLAASLFIYSNLYLSIPANTEISDHAIRSYNAVVAAHPTDSDADLKAKIDAEQQTLVPADRNEAIWVIGCVLLELSLAGAIFLVFPRWKIWREHLRPLNPSTMPEIVRYLKNLCDGVGLFHHPTFLWKPFSLATTGLAFGCLGKYYVVLPAGLVQQFYTDKDAFHVVVLHELAHLRNTDVDKTYFTVSIWWAFVVAALVPIAPWLLYSLYLDASLFLLAPSSFFTLPLHHYAFNIGWRILALAAFVYLIRNAVLRIREAYADVRASIWDGRADRLIRILQFVQRPKRANWSGLLHVHPDANERYQTLNDTSRLFHLGFWEAFGTGITLMIALPNIIYLLYLLHVPGSVGGTGEAAVVGAGLLLAPLTVAVVGLGVWRAELLNLAYGQAPSSLVRLGLGLGFGMLLGQFLSLQDYLFEVFFKYQQNLPLHLGFDIIWSLILITSLFFFLKWVAACISVWLEVAASSSSPNLPFWTGLIFTGGVLGVWIGLLYGLRFLGQSSQLTLNFASFVTLFNITAENPLTLYVFITLWAYPLAAWFWRKRVVRGTGASWLFLDSPQQLVLPPQPSLRLDKALIAGFIGGVAFCILYINIRTGVNHFVPEATRQTEQFYIPFGYSVVVLAILVQACVAAVVASQVQRLGTQHGLFAAFIAGCIMTLEIVVINLIFFSKSALDLATIWISLQTFFGLFVNGGALLALPIAGGVAALANWTRRSEHQNNSFAPVRHPVGTFSMPNTTQLARSSPTFTTTNAILTNSQGPLTGKTIFLVGLVLLMTISCGLASIFFTVVSNETVLAKFHINVTATTFAVQNPYPPHQGKLLLNDPLRDNASGYQWSTLPGCTFTVGAYQADAPTQGLAIDCLAYKTNFSNFAYQVQMKIIKGIRGGVGGIIFRANPSKGSFYDFLIGQDGSYAAYRYDSDGYPTTLRKSSSHAIREGLNQANVIAIVANGSSFDLYVNYQKIDSISDGSYHNGSVGVVADSLNNPSEVVFSNAKVWLLQ